MSALIPLNCCQPSSEWCMGHKGRKKENLSQHHQQVVLGPRGRDTMHTSILLLPCSRAGAILNTHTHQLSHIELFPFKTEAQKNRNSHKWIPENESYEKPHFVTRKFFEEFWKNSIITNILYAILIDISSPLIKRKLILTMKNPFWKFPKYRYFLETSF